jgi:hypothetical protein
MQSKRWCFTINNPTEEEKQKIIQLPSNPNVEFIIAEIEHETEGTCHIQGYIEYKNRIRINQIKSLLSPRSHVEAAVADRTQNITYCSKENNVIIQYTKEPQQSGSHDYWGDLYRYICTGPTPKEFAEQYPKFYLTSPKIDKLLTEQIGQTAETYDGDLQEKNYWVYGPTGVGKSRWANNQRPGAQILHKSINKWWDGYRPYQHTMVLIEDWPKDNTHMEQYIKVWGDRYPFTAEIKGGSLCVEPKRWNLIITSNHSIEEAFQHCTETDIEAIKRRFRQWEIKDTQDIRLTSGINKP